MDEFVDLLLREERVCDVILPRILRCARYCLLPVRPSVNFSMLFRREVLEETNDLEPRVSVLEGDLEDEDDDDEEEEAAAAVPVAEERKRHSAREESSGRRRRSR